MIISGYGIDFKDIERSAHCNSAILEAVGGTRSIETVCVTLRVSRMNDPSPLVP